MDRPLAGQVAGPVPLLKLQMPRANVERDESGTSFFALPHARQVPDFGVPSGRRTAFESEETLSGMEVPTGFSSKCGKVVAMHFIGTSSIAFRAKDRASATIQLLIIAKGRAKGT